MNHNNIELKVLIKGRPIAEYRHHGQTFVEGRAGSEYEIEICNTSSGKVEAILSVDGLSVIDGKPAGPQSTGYLIDARASLRIPGWLLDDKTIAKFAFSGHEKSYTQLSDGDSSNNGVIGIMAFVEKPYSCAPAYTGVWGSSVQPLGGTISNNIWNNSVLPGVICNSASSSWCPAGVTGNLGASGTTGKAALNSIGGNACQTQNQFVMESQSVDVNHVNYLGTAFGEAADFMTTQVPFQRGDMLSYQILYYDDIRGLRARGIVIERHRPRKNVVPNAFPAKQTGCTPPKSWRR